MEYVKGSSSTVRRRDTNRARRIVGLATRRELESKASWQSLFGLDDDGFGLLLERLGISAPEHRKFPRKAISRLRTEAQNRGLLWPGAVYPQKKTNAGEETKLAGTLATMPPFNWRSIGNERNVEYLTEADVRAIHEELIKDFARDNDPIEPPGVRDDHLLASAVTRPSTSLGETRKYPSVEMSAAALLHSLIHNHPFHNGNKRTALVSMLSFLDLNRLLVICDEDDMFKLVLRIAQHSIVPMAFDQLADREVLHISEWVHKNSRRIELEDRSIPFRRLRKLLTRYECSYSSPKKSQIYISRTILRERKFLRDQRLTLSTHIYYGSEGRDVTKISVAKVRKDLQLDEPHGIDSASFYRDAPAAAGEFIIKYRKTLRRLASL